MSTTQNLHKQVESCFYTKTTLKQILSGYRFFLLLEFNRVLDNGIIIKDLRCHGHLSVSSSQIKTTGKQTSYLSHCKVMSIRLIPIGTFQLVIHVVQNRRAEE